LIFTHNSLIKFVYLLKLSWESRIFFLKYQNGLPSQTPWKATL
jgi:hypothetical protein